MFDKISYLKKRRIPFVLCIVVEAKGSTPRKSGSKMIVSQQQTWGTIGGGDLEFAVIEEAKNILNSSKYINPYSKKYNLGKELNMACGGMISIYFEPFYPTDQLVIFGGGHIGKALVYLSQIFDFEIVIIDERKDVLDQIPSNAKKIHGSYTEAIQQINFDNYTYVLSVSHRHTLDLEIAKSVSEKKWAYFGIIASKRKSQIISKALENYGIHKKFIEKIDMPAGIDLKVETPSEIALSVLAKIIDIKNRKRT